MMVHSAFLGFQRSFFLAREGTLDQALRDSIGTAIIAVRDTPGLEFYWKQRKEFFQPEFVEWVEQLRQRDSLHGIEIYRRQTYQRAGQTGTGKADE
jgi:membrane-bound lytic murein transglycosylase